MNRPAAGSPHGLTWLASVGLAVLIPAVLLGSGFAFFRAERISVDDSSLVVTLHLGAETPKYVPASSEFRGARGYRVPATPMEHKVPEPQPAIVEESALKPDTQKPDPESQQAVLEPSAAKPQQAPQPQLQTYRQRQMALGTETDPADAPIATSPSTLATRPAPAASRRPSLNQAILNKFGKRPSLHLPGKPFYPRSCRMGSCKNGVPCEGVGRWQITSPHIGARPTKVKMLASAGCALLDASMKKFLLNSPIPKAGTVEISIRFQITDAEP